MSSRQLEARHRPSGFNSRFEGSPPEFAEYIARCRDMLFKAHSALGTAKIDKVVDGNAPFELQPLAGFAPGRKKACRRGVLLVHGLTDSPYFMRYLAGFFQQNGFRVLSVLLPGHGTQPGDLLDIRWQEWAKAVAYGTDRLAEGAGDIYLAGYSAGASLSVYQSLCDERVRGLFLFSPALRVSPLAAYSNLHKLYSWLYPPGKWLTIKPDLDIYKYESFPKNAAAQMYALTREIEARSHSHGTGIPVFAAASEDDMTASTAATIEFVAQARDPSSKLVLYTANPDKPIRGIPDEKLERVSSVVPGQNIIGFAHTSILIPADDPHYGMQGDYSNCLHYYPEDMEKYSACMSRSGQILQGEITEKNLQAGLLRRLTYNPNFDLLKASMLRFIEGLA